MILTDSQRQNLCRLLLGVSDRVNLVRDFSKLYRISLNKDVSIDINPSDGSYMRADTTVKYLFNGVDEFLIQEALYVIGTSKGLNNLLDEFSPDSPVGNLIKERRETFARVLG